MKIEFTSHRKKTWLANAILFHVSRILYRRNPRLWVYGTREGTKYDDNARYLFEHVNREHGQVIRSVWLAANDEVVGIVRKNGGEAYTFSSKEGRVISHHAGVAIFTNGLDDFGPWPQIGGAKLVYLGHGVGFKRTYNAKYSGKSLVLKKMMDNVFSWIQRDLTIATSQFNKSQRVDIASLSDDALIAITGQPRNDVLRENGNGIREKIFSMLNICTDCHLILYMPTYRSNALGADAMKNIIFDLYNNKELNRVLCETNSIFVAKLHPLTPQINIAARDNFRVLQYQEVESNQELLAAGDMLITDYSSCCVDFALLNRPVVFYVPDKDDFVSKSETVCDEFFDICEKCQCTSADDLAGMITNPTLAATNAINVLYEDETIKGSCYSENVCQSILKVFCKV